MPFVCIIIMWVWHISCMRIKKILAWPMNLDVAIAIIGWEASGMILDCCRCITGVSCTKVLHLFNEAQIFGKFVRSTYNYLTFVRQETPPAHLH